MSACEYTRAKMMSLYPDNTRAMSFVASRFPSWMVSGSRYKAWPPMRKKPCSASSLSIAQFAMCTRLKLKVLILHEWRLFLRTAWAWNKPWSHASDIITCEYEDMAWNSTDCPIGDHRWVTFSKSHYIELCTRSFSPLTRLQPHLGAWQMSGRRRITLAEPSNEFEATFAHKFGHKYVPRHRAGLIAVTWNVNNSNYST